MAASGNLPTSAQGWTSLVFVGGIAATAAICRVLYGKDDVNWRRTTGSAGVAMITSILVYGAAVQYFGEIGGHASAAVGAAVGLFTDETLKRAQNWISNYRIPGDTQNVAPRIQSNSFQGQDGPPKMATPIPIPPPNSPPPTV